MDRIKELLYILLLDGYGSDRVKLTYLLVELGCLSGVECEIGLGGVSIFVDNSLLIIESGSSVLCMDDFIAYYKEVLLDLENYELIIYLGL